MPATFSGDIRTADALYVGGFDLQQGLGFALSIRMPRKALIPSDVYPYQVVSRSNNKEFFLLPLDELWPIFIAILREAKGKYSCCYHFFGGRYKWTIIQDDIYYWNSIKYVFRNPVDAGICSLVEEYKYSSLNSILRFKKLYVVGSLNSLEIKIIKQ